MKDLERNRQAQARNGLSAPVGIDERETLAEIEWLQDAIRAGQSCDQPFPGDAENERALFKRLRDAEKRLEGLRSSDVQTEGQNK